MTTPKFLNFYSVTELCEVRNEKGQLMKPYVHKSRGIFYLRYNLRGKKFMAHVLNWVAHNGPIPKGMQINHKDHNTFNCALYNLELTTAAENRAHRRPSVRRKPLKSKVKR